MECNVRAVRESRGLTLPELAKEIGINKGTLSRIENGIEIWTRKIQEDIATVLGAEVHQYLNVEIRPGVVLKVEVRPRC